MSKSISFQEIGSLVATFFAEDGVEVGQVVEMTDNQTVGTAENGGSFSGVVLNLANDGVATVQVGGFATVKAEGVTAGKVNLVAGDDGCVVEGGSVGYTVVSADEVNGTAVILL